MAKTNRRHHGVKHTYCVWGIYCMTLASVCFTSMQSHALTIAEDAGSSGAKVANIQSSTLKSVSLLSAGSLIEQAQTSAQLEPSMEEQRRNGRKFSKLVSNAKKGKPAIIPAGYYQLSDFYIRKDVHIIGEGEVILQSEGRVAKGVLVTDLGVNLTIENITFRDTRANDLNGAGIRHDGRNLTVIDSIFERNENSILATGSDRGRIEIKNSSFIDSGHGDGRSHGVYLSSGNELIISDSTFIGTKIGHHVKSLAKVTQVSNSYFDDAGAGTSYTFDVTRGGAATFTDNFIIQRETAENSIILNYDLSRQGAKPGAVVMANNRIVNRHPEGRLFRNDSPVKIILDNNVITNEVDGQLRIDKQ